MPGSCFLQLLLIIDDTDLSRRATGVHRFQDGDPGPAEGEQLAAGPGHAPRGAACGPLPKASEERAWRSSGCKARRHVCVRPKRGERKEANVSLPAVRWGEQPAGKIGESRGLLLKHTWLSPVVTGLCTERFSGRWPLAMSLPFERHWGASCTHGDSLPVSLPTSLPASQQREHRGHQQNQQPC